MSRHLRRLCTKPFQIRLEDQIAQPEVPTGPRKTLIREVSGLVSRSLSNRRIPTVIRGPHGVGKSTLLSQAVTHARKNGTLVVYLADMPEWVRGGGFFAAAAVPGLQPHLDGLAAVRFYDRPTQTASIFQNLLTAHADQLAEMPSKKELRSEHSAGCETLHELVELGDQLLRDLDANWRMHPEHAGSVLSQLFNELCATDHPVALVVDDYPALIGLTTMTNERKERLHANAIRFIAEHLGRSAIEHTASRFPGPVLLAADESPPFEEWRQSRVRGGTSFPIEEDIKTDPSGKIWWRGFLQRVEDAGHLLNIPPLIPGEQRALCSTFGIGRDRASDRLVALAGGRGDRMQRVYTTR